MLQRIVEWFLKREGAIKRNLDMSKLLKKAKQHDEQPRDEGEGAPERAEGGKREYFDDRDGSNMALCGSAVGDSFFWASMHLKS